MIVEAEKSHSTLSAGWRTRKANGVIYSESEGLKTRGAGGVTPSPLGLSNHTFNDSTMF